MKALRVSLLGLLGMAALLVGLGCSGPAPALDPIITFAVTGAALPDVTAGEPMAIASTVTLGTVTVGDQTQADQVTDIQWSQSPAVGSFTQPNSLNTVWQADPELVTEDTPVQLRLTVKTLNDGEAVNTINLIVHPADTVQ